MALTILEWIKGRMFNLKTPDNANNLLTGIFETYLDKMIYLRTLLERNYPIHFP